MGVCVLKGIEELLKNEVAFTFSGVDVWDKGLIVCIEVEVGGLVFNDDGFAEGGLEAIGHTRVIGAEDNFVVAF